MERPSLMMTTQDARRLEALIASPQGLSSPMSALLEQELARAEWVDADRISADVVTMNSRVVCRDEISGEQHEIELVYPHQADPQTGKVSVLAPVGAALLGMTVGNTIDWPIPGGRTTRLRVLGVLFQPESAQRTSRVSETAAATAATPPATPRSA